MSRERQSIHHLFGIPYFMYHTIRVWGVVYLLKGLSGTSILINEWLHTFFVLDNAVQGLRQAKKVIMITLEEARIVLSRMYGKPVFDSHDFILTYIREFPYSYFNMLHESKLDVTRTNSGIANFLKNNSYELGIEEGEKVSSLDIFSNPSECAIWKRK